MITSTSVLVRTFLFFVLFHHHIVQKPALGFHPLHGGVPAGKTFQLSNEEPRRRRHGGGGIIIPSDDDDDDDNCFRRCRNLVRLRVTNDSVSARPSASSSSSTSTSSSSSSSPPPSTSSPPSTTTPPPLRDATQRKKDLRTFQRYLEVECWKRTELRGLESVLLAVGDACQRINRVVQRAQTDDLYGVALGKDGKPLEETNTHGEVQQKLDVVCNTIMSRALCGCSKSIASIASEEEDEPISCGDIMDFDSYSEGDFVAVFDPLDGSQNIDASLPVGSIFGIYRKQVGSDKTFLQDGNGLVASGYCLFSAACVLVVTLGSGVHGFTWDPDRGIFLQTHPDIRIPSAGSFYSINEANIRDFDEPVQRYLEALKEGSSAVGTRSSARYIGALVADVHNILINGGIFGYPSTRKFPEGKLRLLYESCPMAMIMEQAGGAASTGRGRILDVQPRKIHQRTPTFLGSLENVYELDQFHMFYGDDDDDAK